MSTLSTSQTGASTREVGPPWGLWAALLALLLTELVGLTIRFDAATLARRSDALGSWLVAADDGVHLALAAATIALIVGGAGLGRELSGRDDLRGRRGRLVVLVASHLAAFVGFAGLTAGVFERGAGPVAVALWGASGLACVALLGLAALPATACWQLARRGAPALALGLAVGLAAWWTMQGHLDRAWRLSQGVTARAVHAGLAGLGQRVAAEAEGEIVGTEAFTVRITTACSGVEGMGLMATFLGVYLANQRRSLRFPAALTLIPIGMAVAWVANVARIILLILVGTWGSPGLATGGFHSQAGWIAFSAVGLGLVALSRKLHAFAKGEIDPTAATTSRTVNPTIPYLAPALAILATAMLTGALTEGPFDRLYPARVAVGAGFLWNGRRAVAPSGWSFSWTAVAAGGLAFVLWMVLEPPTTDPVADRVIPDGLAGLPGTLAALWIAARTVGGVVTVPLAEELAFRGFLARRMASSDFESVRPARLGWWPLLASSLLFGAFHQRWIAGTLAGMSYALVYRRRGRLADAVLAHATTNALIALAVLTTGRWHLWNG